MTNRLIYPILIPVVAGYGAFTMALGVLIGLALSSAWKATAQVVAVGGLLAMLIPVAVVGLGMLFSVLQQLMSRQVELPLEDPPGWAKVIPINPGGCGGGGGDLDDDAG